MKNYSSDQSSDIPANQSHVLPRLFARTLPKVAAIAGFFLGLALNAQAQAIVGQVVGSSPVSPGGAESAAPSYAYYGNQGYSILTNNGLMVYAWNGHYWSSTYTSYINLNDLTVNVASSPLPSGNLSLSQVIGKNGNQVILSWHLN